MTVGPRPLSLTGTTGNALLSHTCSTGNTSLTFTTGSTSLTASPLLQVAPYSYRTAAAVILLMACRWRFRAFGTLNAVYFYLHRFATNDNEGVSSLKSLSNI